MEVSSHRSTAAALPRLAGSVRHQPDHRTHGSRHRVSKRATWRTPTHSHQRVGAWSSAAPPHVQPAAGDLQRRRLRDRHHPALAFVVVGGLWLEHHQLLDPMQTHSRRLARTNLLFLLTVSLLPYWVSVLEAHNDSGAAGGLLLLDMALTGIAFVLVCLGVRAELGPSEATMELVMPALLQSAAAAVLLLGIGAVVTGNPPYAGPRRGAGHGRPRSLRRRRRSRRRLRSPPLAAPFAPPRGSPGGRPRSARFA